jgi:hypothetical protein
MTSKKITIQVYSDIQIESWNKIPILPIKAKYLFLAGNICNQTHPLFYKFFDFYSTKWEKIFYIPGNKEFYIKKKNYNQLDFEYKYRFESRYKNVYYLNNNSVPLDDTIDIYGSIFWPKQNTKINYIDDYKKITYFNKDKGHVVDLDGLYVNHLSQESHKLLQNHLLKTNKKTIVMTHFPPFTSETTNPKYNNDTFNQCMNSYLLWNDDSINDLHLEKVPLWISGHTLWSYSIHKNKTRFISNQLGNKSVVGTTGCIEDGIYELEI